MRLFAFKKSVPALFVFVFAVIVAPGQTSPAEPARSLLPDRFGDFKASGSAVIPKPELTPGFIKVGASDAASRTYLSKDGERFRVTIIRTRSDSAAYALLTEAKIGLDASINQSGVEAGIGAESVLFPDRLMFVKGSAYVVVTPDTAKGKGAEGLVEISKAVAQSLDKGQGDIPVLVKHLPDWQNPHRRMAYALDQTNLKKIVGNQPVLDAVSFEGGAEAVIANYDAQKLVVVEFNTPQLATENDGRITARIHDLRNQGLPLPTAYRRVGNYSVFVFNAPSPEAANQLIDQVKYQQVVQWLGENPYVYREAVAEFTRTTLGVLVSVVKASGLVLLGSLAVGGFLGALLFTRRRAQQQVTEAYSDAGGMLRLNLDEITPQTDSSRLVGPGN